MRYFMRTITWNGRAYRFEAMPAGPGAGIEATERHTTGWAVSLQREFIGEMTCPRDVTTAEFDTRCAVWLEELLNGAPTLGRKGVRR